MAKGNDITQVRRMYREKSAGDFPDLLMVELRKAWELKYAENPNQHGAIYLINGVGAVQIPSEGIMKLSYVRTDDQGKGGLSATNTMDIMRGMDCLKWYDVPAVGIMKHNIIAGFAKQTNPDQSLVDLFRLARDADLRSNFGGTLIVNRPLDKMTAEAMYELKGENPFFVDVLAAPDYDEGVLSYVEAQSKNIRIAKYAGIENLPKFVGDNTYGLHSFKDMGGIMVVQDPYLTSIRSAKDFVVNPMFITKDGVEHTIQRVPTASEMDDLLTAWYLNISGARSNGVVFVKDGVSVAIGSGQVERVGAIEQAIVKGMQKAMDRAKVDYDPLMGIGDFDVYGINPFEGSSCSSDAFFPFRDSIDRFARVKVGAIVQPFGSDRDALVIDAANEYDIAMVATKERCFGHF
jgi:phosphoribosylaminoimidazolecarboxamide formyltransferase/IMP cyclohydrolase